MRKLLFIDDDAAQWRQALRALEPLGYASHLVSDPAKALASIASVQPDVVLLDLHFPETDRDPAGETTGERLLREIRARSSIPVVLFSTRFTDDRISLRDLHADGSFAKDDVQRLGEAWSSALASILDEAIARAELAQRPGDQEDQEMGFLVGETLAMRRLAEQIRLVARTTDPVLLYGETGTGKELAARAIHRLSGRSGEIETLDCGALDEPTATDKIFGHVRGAFTNAVTAMAGLFELADRGTLFLDEFQAIPPFLQNKVVKAVETKQFWRQGDPTRRTADVRLIVATNVSPDKLVGDGAVRNDLYHRLNKWSLTLPPLRDRIEDVGSLAARFIAAANLVHGKHVNTQLHGSVLQLLRKHRWPGNIRELENAIGAAVVRARATFLFPEDIVLAGVAASESEAGSLGSAATIAREIALLPQGRRWDRLMQVGGELRRDVVLALLDSLADASGGRPTSKVLAQLLCDSPLDTDRFKKDHDKVRSLLRDHHLRLRDQGNKDTSSSRR